MMGWGSCCSARKGAGVSEVLGWEEGGLGKGGEIEEGVVVVKGLCGAGIFISLFGGAG